MHTFLIEFDENKPKYIQLYEYIINNIKSGIIKENEKLPSKRMLSIDLKISQNTIENTYELLKSEGYIESKERSGYYVLKYIDSSSKIKVLHTPVENIIKRPKYNLTTSSIDFKSFPIIMWSRLTKEALKSNYYSLGSFQGDYNLRYEISKYLAEYRGINANPDNIVLGSGIEYLIPQLTKILESPFGIENPGYKKVSYILSNNKIKYQLIDLDYNLNNKIKTIYVTPSHQFPTGISMTIRKKHELIKWAINNSSYIIEDDYDSEYRFDGATNTSLYSINNEKVIYLSTFSRTISPSLRIAYMILPDKIITKYKELYQSYANPISRLDQQVLAMFIKNGCYIRHLRKTKTLYKKKRDLIISILKKNKIKFNISNIGLSLLINLDKIVDEDKMINNLLKYDIKINFISSYYYTKCLKSKIVIGFAQIDINDINFVMDKLIKEIKDIE